MGSAEEVKKLATDKIEQLVQRYPDHKSLAKLTALLKEKYGKVKIGKEKANYANLLFR